MRTLSGHTNQATAYVVEDYPYGFRLRCKIRYWLEYVPRKGFRLCSQTSNPKLDNKVWNKPKASTFQRFGGVMVLGDNGHVDWLGLTEYSDVKECAAFLSSYGEAMPAEAREFLRMWISRKLTYEQAKIDGLVRCTITTMDYGCVTDTGFGQPVAVRREAMIVASEFTPEQLAAVGGSLNTEATFKGQLARLAQ